jgi:hypothetical protein
MDLSNLSLINKSYWTSNDLSNATLNDFDKHYCANSTNPTKSQAHLTFESDVSKLCTFYEQIEQA